MQQGGNEHEKDSGAYTRPSFVLGHRGALLVFGEGVPHCRRPCFCHFDRDGDYTFLPAEEDYTGWDRLYFQEDSTVCGDSSGLRVESL